jgi:hypothetical protein
MSFHLFRRQILFFGLPVLLAVFTGCTTFYTIVTPPTNQIAPFTNWQIQTGSVITASPAGAVFLAGALQIQGSQVNATFNTLSLFRTQSLLSYTGSYNSTTGALTLADAVHPAALSVQLTVPAKPTNPSAGTINAAGQTCSLVLSSPAVGVQIPSLTGTYTGTLTSPAGLSGQATLTVTQSATPNSTAQFPISGTLSLTTGGGACGEFGPVTGTISGAAFTLASSATSPTTVTGASTTGGDTLPATTVTVPAGALCGDSSTTYSGTFTLR